MRHIRSALWVTAALALACVEAPAKPKVNVVLNYPADGTHLQGGLVRVEVAYSDQAPDRFELLCDGAVIAEFVLPTYWHDWDADAEPEGEHVLVARAWLGDSSFDSAPVTVVVDRTPPTAVSLAPLANRRARGPFYINLSENVIVEPGDVVVTREGGIPIDVAVWIYADMSSVLVWPRTPLAPPTTVTMKLDGVTDLAGNPLPVTERAFEVPIWWQPLQTIYEGTARIDPPAPSIAMAGDWLAFGWGHSFERCVGSLCRLQTPLAGTPRVAAGGADQLITANLQSTTGPLTVSTWTASGLERLGDTYASSSFMNGLALGVREMADDGHDALVTWNTGKDPAAPFDVRAARLTNGIWKNIGWLAGGPDAATRAWSGAAALAPDGTAFTAITHAYSCGSATCTHVRVLRLSGTSWILVGSPRGTDAGAPSLRVAGDGKLHLAYVERSTGSDVHSERWDGTAWIDLGIVEAEPTDVAHSPSLAIDGAGAPVIALCSHAPGMESEQRVWVRRWDGAGWSTVGAPLNVRDPVRAARTPSLAVDADGDVAAAFYEWTGDGELTSTPPAVPTATWDLRVVQLNR